MAQLFLSHPQAKSIRYTKITKAISEAIRYGLYCCTQILWYSEPCFCVVKTF